ncbi:MAG: response regulator transcription factor [Aureispira sp.]|nr:response regulator transcription factor [Aureispira sp.]
MRVVIIDDERMSIEVLRTYLEELETNAEIVGTAPSVEEGIEVINTTKPGLVFLDIHLKDGYGFDILKQVSYQDFQVVFTTAYHNYAIKAFEFAALHYLLKPIEEEALQEALDRYQKQVETTELTHKDTHQILQNALQDKQLKTLALPAQNSIVFTPVEDVIHCEADGGYTIFHLKDGSRIAVSKALRNYEDGLIPMGFCRIHDKHLINLHFVKRYIRGRGGKVELLDGSVFDVSIRRKNDFLKAMGTL